MGHLHCLRKIALFSQLDDHELEKVAQAGTTRCAEPGEALFAAGDPATEVFIVKCGRIKIFTLDAEGRSFTLAVAGPDSIVGQEAAFSRSHYGVYAEALEGSVLWVFTRAALLSLLRQHVELALSAVQALSVRLAETEERLAQLALGDVKSRTLDVLRRLAALDGVRTADGVALQSKWTHQELSDLVSASRPTITQVLHELAAEGSIRFDGRRIVLRQDAQRAG